MPTRLYFRDTLITSSYWANEYKLSPNAGSYTYNSIGGIHPYSSSIYVISDYQDGSGGGGNVNLITTKHNSDGTIGWQRTYGANGTENYQASLMDSSSNIYILGYNGTDNFLLKYNISGTLQFQRSFNSSTSASVFSGITIDNSGFLYLAGYGNSGSFVNPERARLIKYEPTSNAIIWDVYIASLASSTGSEFRSVYFDSSSNSIYAGGYYGGIFDSDPLLVKYSTDGNIQWKNFFRSGSVNSNGIKGSEIRSIAINPSGEAYCIIAEGNKNSAYLVKTNTSGSITFQKQFITPYPNEVRLVINSYDLYIYDFGNIAKWNTTNDSLEYTRNLVVRNRTGSFFVGNVDNTSLYAGGSGEQIIDSNLSYIFKTDNNGTSTGSYGPYSYNNSSLNIVSCSLFTQSFNATNTGSYPFSGTISTTTITEAPSEYINYGLYTYQGVYPPNQSGVTASMYADNTLRVASTTSGSAQVSIGFTTSASVTRQTVLLGTFVSPTLASAQTVGGGNMILNAAENEINTNVNFWVNALNVYVWDPSTYTKRSIVKENITTSLGGLEPTAAGSEQVTHITGITTNAVSAQAGDIVVCEVWGVFTQGMSTKYDASWFYNGTTTNTTENAVVSNHASFIEFSENLTFGTPSGPSTTKTYFFVLS